jgi:hypothetical protein
MNEVASVAIVMKVLIAKPIRFQRRDKT